MTKTPRLLVVDAYPRDGRARLRDAGGTEAGVLYRRILERLLPAARVDVVHPADGEPEYPGRRTASDYDGVVWTGSNLSILDAEDAAVGRQIELARELLANGTPSFGSCFAIQLAAVAAGGRCAQSPKGREFGVARDIALSPQGRRHPLYRDKPPVFDAFTSHADEVVTLPDAAPLLASNAWSRVQGTSIESGAGTFWAVQYHPEYDLHEVASLCRLRKRELVEQGTFASESAADRYIDELETLHENPERADLAKSLDLGETLLDPNVRQREVRNWLEAKIVDRTAD